MRFAIVGAGVIGKIHARLISTIPEAAELVAVVDTDLARAEALAGRFGGDAMSDLRKACARDDVEAVSICLPSGLHADAAVEALHAGKHVLVEKPLDVTLAEADRIIAAERETGLTVGVISQRRFQKAPAFVHRAIAEGRLGRLTSGIAESTFWRSQEYYDSGGWRGTPALDGGGALMNQGIHAVDLLIWMMGRPVEVQAYSALLAHERIEVEDTVAATVRFAGGAIGTVTAATSAYPGLSVRVAVHGDRGSAVIDREDLAYFHTRDDEQPEDHPEHNQAVPLGGATGQQSIDEAHCEQYLDFVAAVGGGRAPAVGTADARLALELVLGVYESARTGRPVRLGEGEN